MSDEEKRSNEPSSQTSPISQSPQQQDQGEEKKDSDVEEYNYPGFLTVRHCDVAEANGTYFWVHEEGQSAAWVMDKWKISRDSSSRRWILSNPNDVVMARTVKRVGVGSIPVDKKWCVRQTEGSSYQVSAMELLEVLVYREGEEVLSRFRNKWFMATIFKVHLDNTVDLWWHETPSFKSSNVPYSHLRKTRRLTINIKFENFENVNKVARIKIPLSWKIRKLRDLIGLETVTNFEEIKIYQQNGDAALPLGKTIADLGIRVGTFLIAKKEAFEFSKKEDPSGIWSKGEDCEFLCPDIQWRKAVITEIHKSSKGIIAEVTTDLGKDTVHVSEWHRLLRTPGTGHRAPLPPGCLLPFNIGDKVMVTISKGYQSAGMITSAPTVDQGEDNRWKVRLDGEDFDDPKEYAVHELKRVYSQQSQVVNTNINMNCMEGGLVPIFSAVEQISECKDPELLPTVIKNIYDKFSEDKGDNLNALVAETLRKFQQLDTNSLFAEKTEICISLAMLLPNYRMADVPMTLPFDLGVLDPIPDPLSYGDGKYLSGARLSRNLGMDGEFSSSGDNKIPRGSRVVEVARENVHHLSYDDLLQKVRDAHSATGVIDFVFNVAGTIRWVEWWKNQGLDHRESAPAPPGTFHRNSVEAPPPSDETFQINDIVYLLVDGETKIANIVDSDWNYTYTVAFIEKDKMDPPRRGVHGSLLAKNPLNLTKDAQTQSQPVQRAYKRHTIVDSIYTYLRDRSGYNNKKEGIPVSEVRTMLIEKFPLDDFELLLCCTLEEFLEREEQYEFTKGDEESPPNVRLLARFVQQEMRELNNGEGARALNAPGAFHPPMQLPEAKAEITEEKLDILRTTASSMGIYRSNDILEMAIKSNIDDLQSQISYLLDRI